MRTRRSKLIVLAAVGICSLIAVFVLTSASPPIRLTVREFTTNGFGLRAPQIGSQSVYAIIEVTNTGARPITFYSYWSRSWNGPHAAHTVLLSEGAMGWMPRPVFREACRNPQILAPSESATFVAQIDSDRPCRVALDYSDGRTPSRLWQRLPRWITQRLPWGRSGQMVTTDTIDWQRISRERPKT